MVQDNSGQASEHTTKIMCPECDCVCEPYGHYKTVGLCPKCKKHYTIADASQPEIVSIRLDDGVDGIDRMEH